MSQLFDAIRQNNTTRIEKLLEEGCDPSVPYNSISMLGERETAIVQAIEKGNSWLFHLLLKYKADILATCSTYLGADVYDAICAAISKESQHLPYLVLLATNQGQLNNLQTKKYSMRFKRNSTGSVSHGDKTIHMDVTYLHWAALVRNRFAIKLLVAFGIDTKRTTQNGKTAEQLWPEGFAAAPASECFRFVDLLKVPKFADLSLQYNE